MVEAMLAARGICVTYETVRQWGNKFGKIFADQIRRRAPTPIQRSPCRPMGASSPGREDKSALAINDAVAALLQP